MSTVFGEASPAPRSLPAGTVPFEGNTQTREEPPAECPPHHKSAVRSVTRLVFELLETHWACLRINPSASEEILPSEITHADSSRSIYNANSKNRNLEPHFGALAMGSSGSTTWDARPGHYQIVRMPRPRGGMRTGLRWLQTSGCPAACRDRAIPAL